MATQKESIAFELQVNADGAVVAGKNFKQQLREATQEANKLAIAFGATSSEAVKAAQKVANMKEELADVKDTINALNPEAKFNAVAGAVQGIAGGFAAAQGAMALFGAQSEEVQQQMLKVQGALALSQGINQVLGLGDAFKNLGIVLRSTAIYQAAYNFVTSAGTVATRLFNLALLAIPFVAIAAGIVLIVANFDKLKKIFNDNKEAIMNVIEFMYRFLTPVGLIQTGIEKLATKFEFVRVIIDSVKKSFTALWDSLISGLQYLNLIDTAEENLADAEADRSEESLKQFDEKAKARERDIALAKAQGATEKELRVLEIKSLEESKAAYEEYVFARKKAGEEITAAEQEELEARRAKYKIAILEDDRITKAETAKKIKDEQDKAKKLADERKKARADRLKEEEDERKRLADLDKQIAQEKIKSLQDSFEKERQQLILEFNEKIKILQGNGAREIELRRLIEENKNAAINQVNENERLANIAKQKELLQKQFENDNATLQARLINSQSGSIAFFSAERDIENANYNQQLQLQQLSAEQRELIEAKHQQRLRDIDEQQGNERIKIQQQIEGAKLSIAEGAVHSLASINQLIGNNSAKAQETAKKIAVIQIAVDTAKAISSTIAGASAAAAAGGPAAPFLLIGYVATGIATVLGAFVQAKKLLGDSGSVSAGSALSNNTAPHGVNFTTTQTPTTIVNRQPQTVKAFVVETDITNSQDRVKQIQNRAAFN